MINEKDDYFHEYTMKKDWIEFFHFDFVNKKNKLYGSADVEFQFNNKKIEFSWIIIFNNQIYTYNNSITLNKNMNKKKISDNKFDFTIVNPLERYKLTLRDKSITANLNLTGIFPIYDFPANIADTGPKGEMIFEDKQWNKYEQRCKITGNIAVKTGKDKGKKGTLDCFGQREHFWGFKPTDKITCHSNIVVQFRDMTMNLTYIENDRIPFSNGFISKKSGNIPIQNVECESFSYKDLTSGISASEFSYKDAQDDVDLLVGKSYYSVPILLEQNKKKKYLKFRNFSEFTIIGTNKKGQGVETHYIALERLEEIKKTDVKKSKK